MDEILKNIGFVFPKVKKPYTLPVQAAMKCIQSPYKNIRLTNFTFKDGCMANETGTLCVQAKNKPSMKNAILAANGIIMGYNH